MDGNVIDIECDIPTREVYQAILDDVRQGKIDQGMANYLNIFGPGWAAAMGMSSEQFEEAKSEVGITKIYEKIIESFVENAESEEGFLEMLDDAGVSHACVGTGWFATIEHTASLADRHRGRLIPWFRISPFKGMTGVRELERNVRELGFKGFYVSSFRDGIYANDKKHYPYYAKCVELGIPIRFHTSMNYASDKAMDLGRPIYLDEVARDFPELTIIAGLGGWPWVPELVGLARRHANVYLDLAAHRPKHIAKPGSGFEVLLQFGNTLLQDKVLFASAWMTLSMPLRQVIEEMNELPLKDAVKKKWMFENAARILELE